MAKGNESVADVRESAPVAPSGRLSEAEFKSAERTVKQKLDAQPKVRIRVALPNDITPEEAKAMPKPPNIPVGINGYNYQVKLGEEVSVPSEVAEVLRRAGKI